MDPSGSDVVAGLLPVVELLADVEPSGQTGVEVVAERSGRRPHHVFGLRTEATAAGAGAVAFVPRDDSAPHPSAGLGGVGRRGELAPVGEHEERASRFGDPERLVEPRDAPLQVAALVPVVAGEVRADDLRPSEHVLVRCRAHPVAAGEASGGVGRVTDDGVDAFVGERGHHGEALASEHLPAGAGVERDGARAGKHGLQVGEEAEVVGGDDPSAELIHRRVAHAVASPPANVRGLDSMPWTRSGRPA